MMNTFSVSAVLDSLEQAGLVAGVRGDIPETASSITDDSRTVSAGALFIAVRGSARDGHEFLDAAAERGAAMAIVEDASSTALPAIIVHDSRRSAAAAAAAAFGEPGRSLRLIGVTGTNGKTTTVSILRHLLDDAPGCRSASIGTLGILLGSAGRMLPGGNDLTTPGPVELQRALRMLVDSGVRAVAMETSSHSLHQRRVDGLFFEAAVFTNLTRDHLDYHGTETAYFEAKARLVGHLAHRGAAIVNADDPSWVSLPPAPRTILFGESAQAAIQASDVRFSSRGSEWVLSIGSERHEIRLPLFGAFNVSNALAAAGAAWHMGLSPSLIAARLQSVPQVPGRLEMLRNRPAVLRDYAHTPDALERSLKAVRPFVSRRLIVVFGCGGDRDRGKRPLMGKVAARLADFTILTSDNPRTEDPERILDEIEAGIDGAPHDRVEDRRSAIERAIRLAEPGDTVLLAGKGHETYQIRGTTKLPFDEKVVVGELMAGRD